MSNSDQPGSEAFRWLDAHLVDSLYAPDEAFDWVHMLREEDWDLFGKVWAERSAAWREALVYVLVDGPVLRAQPLLRRALVDLDLDVASQAAVTLCHQMVNYPDECPLDRTLLPRLRELRKVVDGDMREVDMVIGRCSEGS